jgi:hypothetical protein
MIDIVLYGGQRIDGNVGSEIAAGGDANPYQSAVGLGYVGGQPFGLGVSGIVFGTGVTDANYAGVFYNNSLIDTRNGAGDANLTSTDLSKANPVVVWKGGAAKAKLFKGTRDDVSDARAPFASGVTWAYGDNLFIRNAGGGMWTNVTGSGATLSHGKVVKPPASIDDTMIAILVDTPAS